MPPSRSTRKQDGVRILKVNGGGEVPTDYASLQTFRLLGHLPLVLHPDPAEVLVIAFGGGITLSTAELHQPTRLDCAELVPGVPRAAPYFARYNRQIATRLDQAPIELVAEDGRNHVLRTQRQYDAIICDATHPGTADSWVLYTEEFYRLCRRRVGPDGLVAQWLPLHGLSVEDYRMILRTFRAVYPHASLWLTQQYSILLGSPDALHIDYATLERKLGQSAVRANLRSVDLGDPPSFLSALVLGEKELAAYAGSGPITIRTTARTSALPTAGRRGTSGGLPVLKSLAEHLVTNPRPYLSGRHFRGSCRNTRTALGRPAAYCAWDDCLARKGWRTSGSGLCAGAGNRPRRSAARCADSNNCAGRATAP